MTKRNQILLTILVIQIALAFYLLWPYSNSSKVSSGTLLPGMAVEDITELTIKDGEGKSVRIQKQGRVWGLPAYGGYPADQGKLTPFLKKITTLETKPLVARKRSSHRRLKVAENEFERFITVSAVEQKEPQSLYVGTSPSYKKVHVRAGSGDEVYAAQDFSVWEADAEPSSWIDNLYFSVEKNSVVKISLKNAHGTINLERGEQNEWILQGIKPSTTLNVEEWEQMLRKAVSIRLDEPLGREELPEFGLKTPSAILAIVTEGTAGCKEGAHNKENGQESGLEKVQKTYTIRIGTKGKEGKGYVVKSSESPFFVRVPGYAVEPFVEKGVEDLTKKREQMSEEEDTNS